MKSKIIEFEQPKHDQQRPMVVIKLSETGGAVIATLYAGRQRVRSAKVTDRPVGGVVRDFPACAEQALENLFYAE